VEEHLWSEHLVWRGSPPVRASPVAIGDRCTMQLTPQQIVTTRASNLCGGTMSGQRCSVAQW